MRRSFLRASVVFSLVVALGGCATAPILPPEAGSALVYHLDAGDRVRMTVFNDPTLSGEFAVSGEGNLSLPLIGNVPVRGKSVDEAMLLIQTGLGAGYVKDPRVTLEVLNYRPYYILGEVARSGQYPFAIGLTIQQAVAAAGGFSYRANTRYLFITRAGEAVEHRIDIKSSNAHVMPGDTIRIGERYF